MSRATWADTLDEATIFLENNQPPRRSPEDRPLKACLKKVRGVLNDMRVSTSIPPRCSVPLPPFPSLFQMF